jgi:segregation and condensation protein A
MAFDVATPVFEGPFDLLLHLILKEQVDIHEVSLSRIVDAYLTEIERLQAVDLDVATEFLLIASTLVELKARRLLPGREDVDLDEELALWEERDLLLARLVECKTFKDVAAVFGRFADDADRCYGRQSGPDDRFADLLPDLLEGVSPERVRNAYVRATTPRPVPRIDLFHVAPVRASVADAVEELLDELPRAGRITFGRLTTGLVERLEVIVRFLALLELFKQGVVDLDQEDRFGEIEISWLGLDASDDDHPIGDDRERVLAIDDYDG